MHGDRGNNSLQQRLDYIQAEPEAITKNGPALETGSFLGRFATFRCQYISRT
jgi:hypothetical protein